MKLIETIYKGYDWDSCEHDVDRRVEVSIVGESGIHEGSVSFGNGEPEDMTLGRDLNDVYSIADLIFKAYEAGRDGKQLSRETVVHNEGGGE